MKKSTIILISIFFAACSSDQTFNSDKWKTNKDEQFYMLNDIVENKRLLGKTKKEITTLLDTNDAKQFKYADDFWMFIVSIPYDVPATKTPVKVLDIEFQNDKVTNVILRK
jgi:hypothetical protein